ncbi:hypothetical protein ANSO36C_30980 [Nostoc cf. commune SO-36]|uniref:Peptidase M48 domain-containing protein n=1 Tax=Nostoc cf. commune SO-36 TaxID=449208 RepID=A0ABM7Z2U3_NOSCO|nr:hypothetical protein ANSO36C_30980 [Nostoc cf. commune SO-36]
MPGASLLLKKVNEYGIDHLLRLQSLGSEIRISSRNFPELHQAFVETCQILDVALLPELYLFRGRGNIETYIVGIEKPLVGINLDAMEWLDTNELLYIFGHEVARIKSQQMGYHQMAIVMPTLKNLLSSTTLGVGGLVASGMERGLYNWRMMARFTADRAGLLACQDIDVATTTLMKLAGLPDEYLTTAVIEDFLIQARELASNSFDTVNKVTKILSYTESELSWVVMRAGELLKWVDSGEYDNLIQQTNLKTPEEPEETEGKTPEEKEGWNFLTSW